MWRQLLALNVVGALLAMAAMPPAIAQTGKAAGFLSVDGAKVALASVAAVGYKSPLGQMVTILLSDKPADARTFAEDTRGMGSGDSYAPGIFSGAWKSQHFAKRYSGLTVTLAEDGRLVDEEILVGGKNQTFSIGTDEYTVELTSKAPRLAGRIRTKSPVVDVGRKVGIDVTFEVPVAAPPK